MEVILRRRFFSGSVLQGPLEGTEFFHFLTLGVQVVGGRDYREQ
jgi:hypothetical protein